jgi:hypothetical protein
VVPARDRKSMELTLTLSAESTRMLESLSELGIYGATKEEVAARFIDARLQELVEPPRFKKSMFRRTRENR